MTKTTENARRSARTSTDERASRAASADHTVTDILSAAGLCLGVYGLLVLLTVSYQVSLSALGW